MGRFIPRIEEIMSMIVVFVIIFLGIATYILVYWIKLNKYNQTPLKIKTFDGLDSPLHPSVLYFKDKWNGWKYWMVETPFSPKCKPYVDRNECPSIHVSNDGVNWVTPNGFKNPLVNFGDEGEKNLDYYSDPHLVMANGRMECWFRLTERHGDVNHRSEVSLRRIWTTNGKDWNNEEIICSLWKNEESVGLGKMVVSPALIWDAQTGYKMWYVDSENHSGQRNIVVSTSSDGYIWSSSSRCILVGKNINPWHLDVFKDDGESLLMTVYDKDSLSFWKSIDGSTWTFIRDLLSPCEVVGSFYSKGLYRSCIIKDDIEYKLYFSGYNMDRTSIGLASFRSPGDAISVYTKGKNKYFSGFVIYLLMTEYKRFHFVFNKFIKKIIQ